MSVIRLTQGSTTYKFRLANWQEENAARAYTRSLPLAQFESIIGEDEYRVPSNPDFLVWSADSWKGGEGETVWRESRPDIYHNSFNVRPVAVGDGLVLGAEQQASLNDAGTPAIHNEGARLGVGAGKLWSGTDTSMHPWQPATENWDATAVTTGFVAKPIVNFADIGFEENLFLGEATNNTIRVVKPGAHAEWYATGTFTYDPLLLGFQGVLYALDGDDLYAVTGLNTRVQKTDATIFAGVSFTFLGTAVSAHYRMTASDVGPIWIQRTDNGQCFILEYNHFADTSRIRAQLPSHIWPYDLAFFDGFSFTAYRHAADETKEGDAYLYYERGGQKGSVGPIRSQTGVTASKPVRIGGMIGSDLIIYFDGALWAYDLSSGGISMVADCIATTNVPSNVVVWGKDVFIADVTSGLATDSIERISLDSYTTVTGAYLTSGSLDFRLPGVDKCLLEVIVTTDGLPANTTLGVAYSKDGGSFTTHATTSSTDGDTVHRFVVSTSTASVIGRTFEIRVLPTTTATGSTVTIRNITAYAAPVAKRWYYEFLLDLGDTGTEAGVPQEAAQVIADLKALETTGGVWSLSYDGDVREHDAPSTTEVVIQDVDTAPVPMEYGFLGRIRMAAVSTV